MKYRLGLDLGVGSIGSAIIELDNENNAKDVLEKIAEIQSRKV